MRERERGYPACIRRARFFRAVTGLGPTRFRWIVSRAMASVLAIGLEA